MNCPIFLVSVQELTRLVLAGEMPWRKAGITTIPMSRVTATQKPASPTVNGTKSSGSQSQHRLSIPSLQSCFRLWHPVTKASKGSAMLEQGAQYFCLHEPNGRPPQNALSSATTQLILSVLASL